jgi:hypothetical protein
MLSLFQLSNPDIRRHHRKRKQGFAKMETLAILKSKELSLVEEKNAFLFSYWYDQVCSIFSSNFT